MKQFLTTIFILCMAVCGIRAQVTEPTEQDDGIEYEAMQTDYGYYGTTNALFSTSETVICTFSLTQNKPKCRCLLYEESGADHQADS